MWNQATFIPLRDSHGALRVRIHPVNVNHDLIGYLVGPGSGHPKLPRGLRAQLSVIACSQRIDGVNPRSYVDNHNANLRESVGPDSNGCLTMAHHKRYPIVSGTRTLHHHRTF